MSETCQIWNWTPTTQGSTRPAVNITSADSDAELSRVQVTVEPYGSDAASIELDSAVSGITINTATAGAWDFTIEPIAAATTGALSPGFYTINMTITAPAGTVLEPVKGTWHITAK